MERLYKSTANRPARAEHQRLVLARSEEGGSVTHVFYVSYVAKQAKIRLSNETTKLCIV